MLFLIEYDRRAGKRVTFQRFSDSQRMAARDAQLNIELNLNRNGVDNEVVILEAEDEATIRRTHRRYFENLHQLLKAAGDV